MAWGLAEERFEEVATPVGAERAAVRELVKAAQDLGEHSDQPRTGLLKSIPEQVLESRSRSGGTPLAEAMAEHVGYDKDAVEGRNGGYSRTAPGPRQR